MREKKPANMWNVNIPIAITTKSVWVCVCVCVRMYLWLCFFYVKKGEKKTAATIHIHCDNKYTQSEKIFCLFHSNTLGLISRSKYLIVFVLVTGILCILYTHVRIYYINERHASCAVYIHTYWWSHFDEEQTEWSIWYVDSNKMWGENILMKWLWHGMLFACSLARLLKSSAIRMAQGISIIITIMLIAYISGRIGEERGGEDQTV